MSFYERAAVPRKLKPSLNMCYEISWSESLRTTNNVPFILLRLTIQRSLALETFNANISSGAETLNYFFLICLFQIGGYSKLAYFRNIFLWKSSGPKKIERQKVENICVRRLYHNFSHICLKHQTIHFRVAVGALVKELCFIWVGLLPFNCRSIRLMAFGWNGF